MVAIFKLQERCDWWIWLCPKHLAEWLARGWAVRERKEPPHPLTCSDCTTESTSPTENIT